MVYVLTIIFSVLLLYISFQFHYLRKREQALHVRESQIFGEAEQILKNTHKRSVKIISRAVVKSKEILGHTTAFKQEIEQQADAAVLESIQHYAHRLEQSSEEIAKAYEELFEQLKQEYIDFGRNKAQAMEEEVEEEIELFGKELKEKTEQYQQNVTQVVEQEKQAVVAIENTATQEIAKVSEDIKVRTEEFSKDLESKLGESFSIAQSEMHKLSESVAKIEETARLSMEQFEQALQQKAMEYQQQLEARMQAEVQFAENESLKYKDAIAKIEEIGNDGAEKLGKLITDSTMNAQRNMEQKIQDEFERAKAEIAAYKQQEMDKVKERAEDLIKKLSVELLGRSIKADDHEKLLIEALEEAKKENIFA